jgi:glycosyltransferase involved in cell wall biosynthesis
VIAGHAVPGAAIARRALGPRSYLVKIHGSDIEYAMRPQRRYVDLAREGLVDALAVAGSSRDVLDRCVDLVPGIDPIARVVHPGVDADRFHPRERRETLLDVAGRLDTDPDAVRGRPASLDDRVRAAAAARDLDALDALASTYDQTVPDRGAADVLRSLASRDRPLVGYLGKLIRQKGAASLLAALARSSARPDALVIGFGLERERLTALALALRDGDAETAAWVLASMDARIEPRDLPRLPLGSDVAFVGRLDHRYAPGALAALDVLVVPSVLDEAFGMVAAEGASAGALPLVARHSGLAEVAAALETHAGRPGLFSFEPDPEASGAIAEGIDRMLAIAPADRRELGGALAAFVRDEWSWRRTADALLGLAEDG